MRLAPGLRRVEHGGPERGLGGGVGDGAIPPGGGELGLPAGLRGGEQLEVGVVDEEREGRRLGVLLAHQEQRRERPEDDGGGGHEAPGPAVRRALAVGGVADVVVIGGEHDEAAGIDVVGRPTMAATPERRVPAVEHPAVGEGVGEVADAVVVGVVAPPVAEQGDVQAVVDVVVPHAVEPDATSLDRRDEPGVVAGALGDDEHVPPERLGPGVHGLAELLQERPGRLIGDGIDGVEAEAVDVEVLDPLTGALHEQVADLVAAGAGHVDGVAPRRAGRVDEVGAVAGEDVALRAEVVVHDVDDDAEAAVVGGVDEAGQAVGPAVHLLDGRREHTVVAPVAGAGRGVQRHQLDEGDAERGEAVELADGGVERALGREHAHVELVVHRVHEGDAAPAAVGPRVLGRVDDG